MILIVLLASPGIPAAAQDGAATFRAGVADVRVDVRVSDGKRPVTDLTKDDFAVFDDGKVHPLDYFGHDAEPVSLVLLLDVSGSMQVHLEEMAARAKEALSLLRPKDRVAIMVFGRRSEVHQDFSDNLAETARQIGLAIRGHDVGAGTAINSAILDAAEYMKSRAEPGFGRRAILIVTDNLCLNYRLPDAKIVRKLYSADAVLDAIVTGRAIRPSPPKPGQYTNPDFTPADVFHIAEETGGQAIRANHTGEAMRDLIEAIRARYSLAYHAPEGTPGSFRHIEVKLSLPARERHPNVIVQYRSGYYVPTS